MTPDKFIDQILVGARTCQRTSGIPASFTIAQAALESSWGNRAPGNNLFGIKADPSWKGATVPILTHEVVRGQRVAIIANFRAYASMGDSLVDHARFFLDNPRYRQCFLEKTGEGWARAAANAGYATDPGYADKLISIMRGRDLARFDVLPAEVKP
jgi:flagellar protein FlgJ